MLTKKFLKGGKAIFTVHNDKDEHYTYKIQQADFDNFQPYFIYYLTGPDNNSDYTYLGMVQFDKKPRVKLTNASKLDKEAKPYRVAVWAINLVLNGKEPPEGYGINHEGRCGRCGKKLTRPEGVDPEGYRYGFGPHCWTKIKEKEQTKPTQEREYDLTVV